MSEKLKTPKTGEYFDELYGVDGDGLGEGEVVCEEELELLGLKLAQNPRHRERHGRVWENPL